MRLINFLSILCVVVGLSACDDGIPEKLEFAEFKKVYLSSASDAPRRVSLLSVRDTSIVFGNVAYGGTTWFGEGDIVANIAPDFSLVESYNEENLTSYEPLPEDSFAFDITKLVIASGHSYSTVAKLFFVPGELDVYTTYMLPVVIESVSGNLEVNEDKNTAYLIIAFGGDAVPVKKDLYPLSFVTTSGVNNMTVTQGDGFITMISTGGDPNITTTKLGRVMAEGEHRVVAFEYISNKNNTKAEFFYCVAGGAEGGKSSGQSITIPQASDWTRFEFDLTTAINSFGFGTSADHFFRFDPINEAGYEISIRNLQVEVYPID